MLPLVISSTVLFFIGVAFCYFFVFGPVFKFIQSFAPKSITAAPDIEAYLSFVMTMFIAFGAAFEVPVVVVVLARMGLVSVEELRQFRSFFIVIAFIVAAVITPPDIVSQLALAIPMCLLYEARHLGGADLHQEHAGAGRDATARAATVVVPTTAYCGGGRATLFGRWPTVTVRSSALSPRCTEVALPSAA